MIERDLSLRDYARLMSLSDMPGLTREFPWLAPVAKASAAKTSKDNGKERSGTKPPAKWMKPPTEAGYEYRQCYKPRCRCMKGGA
jgi:hypothetical protein